VLGLDRLTNDVKRSAACCSAADEEKFNLNVAERRRDASFGRQLHPQSQCPWYFPWTTQPQHHEMGVIVLH
jgi:hypothetical protein